MSPVGLVRGSDDYLLDGGAAAASLKQRPRPGHVGLEGRDRVAVSDCDDGLCGEMYHSVNLVFAERALYLRLVAQVAAHHFDLLKQTPAHQLALRHPVAHQAHCIRAHVKQAADEPTTHKASRAGDKRRTIKPESFPAHSHT